MSDLRIFKKLKSLIGFVLLQSAGIYRRLRGGQQPHSLEAVFRDIYLNNSWADPESVSGRGSTLARTDVIRRELPPLLEKSGIKSLLDAACGDFNWMQHIDLNGIEYIGVDVVPELIERNRRSYATSDRSFTSLDITTDPIPKADAILCRDCFIHLSFEQVHNAIANFKRSDSRWLLATTHANIERNTDTLPGGWRNLNLQLPPFNFPQPIELLIEDSELGKLLGMWKIE